MVELKLLVGLNLYAPGTQHSSGLWNGINPNHICYNVSQRTYGANDLMQVDWQVWYLYWDRTYLRHRCGNVTTWGGSGHYSGLVPKIYTGGQYSELSADLNAQLYFKPYNIAPTDTGWIGFAPQGDFAPSVIQMDAGVYGYANLPGIDSDQRIRFSFKDDGTVGSIDFRHRWESLIDQPAPGDPDQKRYLFYRIPDPGSLRPGRTSYLESFYNDQIPFGNVMQSTPKKFIQGDNLYNYEYLTTLMNSQVEKEYLGNTAYESTMLEYDFDGGSDYPSNLRHHRYNIVNAKPGNNFAVYGTTFFTQYNFPYKLTNSTLGSYYPWNLSSGTTWDIRKCLCWNVIRFRTQGNTYSAHGFISNCPDVGTVANAHVLPTNKFTYSGLCVFNPYIPSESGPGGYAMNAGEWMNFKLCPSVWHLSPSWDLISQSSQVKLSDIDKAGSPIPPYTPNVGSWYFNIRRMGFGDMSAARFNAC